MAVPDFQSFFKPLLDLAADGKEHSIQEAREVIAKVMALPEADLKEPLPSGIQTKFEKSSCLGEELFYPSESLGVPTA